MNSITQFSAKKKAFTLVEIMVVLAIIMTLAILALPNFLRSRMNANEIAAITSVRNIANACQVFYATSNRNTYPSSLQDLAPPTSNPPYIDDVLASGSKQGYDFEYNKLNDEHFTLNANPQSPGRTGVRYFYTDETSLIRQNESGPASALDPPAQ
jgi:type II secretory pathway pseudopilin PulG